MREKVELESKGGRYVVRALTNRTEPHIGKAISEEDVQKLILEAKQYGELVINIK